MCPNLLIMTQIHVGNDAPGLFMRRIINGSRWDGIGNVCCTLSHPDYFAKMDPLTNK